LGKTPAAIILLSMFLLVQVPVLPATDQPSQILQGATDYPWTMFRQDAVRDGSSLTTAPGSPTLMWTKVTGGPVYASPVVSDGMVFVPSWDGTLYAMDEYSGQVKWTFATSGNIYSSPAVVSGVVYLASRDGQVYAINEQSGVQLWRTNNIFNGPTYPITSSLLVADGRVFFGDWCLGPRCSTIGYLESLDAATGNILWLNATSAPVIAPPSLDNGRVFFGEDDGTILAVNETTGHRFWSVNVASTVRNAPAVVNGRVFIGSFNRFYSLNEATGATVWSFTNNNANTTSAAVYQGVVYFGTGRGNVYAFNSTTGVQIWATTLSTGGVTSSPALAIGSKVLLVGSNDHNVYALNMTNGSRLTATGWPYRTGGPVSSSPAVADGRVFFGSQDSVIYALGAKIPQLHATILAGTTTLLPGQISNLTISVTDGTNPVSASLTLTSSLGGGISPPVQLGPGTYESNYTAPLVTSPSTTTIQVVVSASGYLDGSSQTGIGLVPYPTLSVFVTAKPGSVNPGGNVLLMIRVENGTTPVPGAQISLSSNQGGSFSSLTDIGGGNYTATFSAELQSTNPTLTVQASKPSFTPGETQVTVQIVGIPDLTSAKAFGVPVWLIAGGALALFLMILLAVVASRRRDGGRAGSFDSSY
jgi:eukaryotic-like serine/threonine-protein kinase